MNHKKNLIFVASLFVVYSLFAQTADEASAFFEAGNNYFGAGDYDSAISYYTKAVPLYEKVYGLHHLCTADNYFLLGVSYSQMRDYQTAVSWLEKAFAIYDSPQGDKASAANALLEIGDAYFNGSDYNTALKYYQKCLSLRKSIFGENHKDTAKCYANIGLVYEFKCDYKSALSYFQKALAIRQKVFGENHLETTDSYHDIAAENYLLGNYEEAIDYFLKALDIRKSIAGSASYEAAHTLGALATVYIDTEWYEDALWANDTAEQIYTELLPPLSSNFAMLYNEKGRIYWGLGNYDKTLHYYGKSLEIYQTVYGEENVYTAKAYLNIGHVYQAMGDYSRAIANLEKSLEINRAIFGNSHFDIALCYEQLGAVYRSKNDFDTALAYFNQALDMYKRLVGETHIEVARCYLLIGSIHENKKDYQTAIDCYRKANNISYEIFGYETKTTAMAYDSIARIYDILGYYEDAKYLYKAAINVYKERCGDNSIDTAIEYVNLGWHYAGQNDAKQAVESFRKAYVGFKNATNYNQVITSLNLILRDSKVFHYDIDTSFIRDTIALAADTVERARLDMTSLKSDLLRKSLPVYYYGVDFEARHDNPAKAFEYAEMLRSRGFLDEIGLERAVSLDGVTDGEREQIKELHAKIASARKEIENQNNLELKDRDKKKLTQAEKNIATAEKSLAKLDDAIGKRIPQYAQLRNPQTVSAKSAQKWCGKDTAILEYVLWSPTILENTDMQGKTLALGSYCLVITDKSVTAIPLDDGYDFNAAITKLRDNVIPKTSRAKPMPEVVFEDVRNELYEKLIVPALPHLQGAKQLLIVPDGNLAFLPFDILRKNEDAKMLCQQFALALSPSVSVSMLADSTRNEELSMLAFGAAWYDANMSEEEHRRTFSMQDMERGKRRGFALPTENNLKDLPGTLTELNTLKDNVFKGKGYEQYVQEAASEQTVKQLSKNGTLSTYPLLHFACHGHFDKSIATMSSILFSEVSGKLGGVSSEDGYLTISEVSLLNLDADLVCLSACETGLGEVRIGDGMIGLNRAFMVAGGQRVGVTLWGVDDEATAEFMASMYKKVKQNGMDYEQAYRRTKAEFQKSEYYSHPYYWAAFVLYE
ncbi:MAG: CHAT domain-containing protein [Treponemataceae bacterium]|nr:CHAT domain-containing protein [Treponemataceae bacterium]